MDRNCRNRPKEGSSAPSDAWLFAQALLGKPIPNPTAEASRASAERERLEWLASISTEHEKQLRRLQTAEAEARRKRELLKWLASFSTEHERQLRRIQAAEAEAALAQRNYERFAQSADIQEAKRDPSKHPRGGFPQNRGWWSPSGGSGGASSSPSFFDAVIRRNQAITDLSGVVTPGMIRSTRIAAELQSAATLPDEIAGAAAAGLGTGGKAVVNGFATAVKSAATLGLDTEQLELIGVSKEDRDRGYDTATAISTASGQVLIAVGTGGIASALSKGGTIARSASGALVAYDAAGNAIGVVKGVVDASTNGVSVSNGAQVAGGLLGLASNAAAARNVAASASPAAKTPGLPTAERRLPFADSQRAANANNTLDTIESGGPFPFNKDGTIFHNRDGKLPPGNYREYTVETPGASNRARRRMIVDQDSGRTYYSDDHYNSFVQIDPRKKSS